MSFELDLKLKISALLFSLGYIWSMGTIKTMDNKSVHWPSLISQIPDPPKKLYYVGDVVPLSSRLVAVVGSREMSKRGEDAVRRIVPDLVKRGVGIVSGLALGVDTLAHKICLDCGGYTVAVMGMGLDRIYPWENKELAERIVANGGCLLSEYEVGHKTIRSDFLKRNRIVSGLCVGTLVIEAAGRSGSISTPNFAVDQGREVWVVEAHEGEPNSEGILALIEDGATVINDASGILSDVN